MKFKIQPIDNLQLQEKILHKINHKTKPIGALGTLEKIALQVGLIQNTEQPALEKPTIIVFAADHGIAKEGEVNPYPQEVTAQMVFNFLQGGAAINVFCKQNAITLKVVDSGVNHDFEKVQGLIHAKIAYGTQNYQTQPAMSAKQCAEAMQKGADIVEQSSAEGSNIIGFGEMGIGNTSSAALLMAYFTKTPIATCVGAGTGVNAEGFRKKQEILSEVYDKYNPASPLEALSIFGGFEIVMIVGAVLRASELKMTILVDGFIVTAALLVAQSLHSAVMDYCIFTHVSDEQGHQKMLQFLDKMPLINLGLRLGEGTGVAVAYPLVLSAVNFLNQMASFEGAGVSHK